MGIHQQEKKPAGRLAIISVAFLVISMAVLYFPYENRPSGYFGSLVMGMLVGLGLLTFLVLGIIALVFHVRNKKAEKRNETGQNNS